MLIKYLLNEWRIREGIPGRWDGMDTSTGSVQQELELIWAYRDVNEIWDSTRRSGMFGSAEFGLTGSMDTCSPRRSQALKHEHRMFQWCKRKLGSNRSLPGFCPGWNLLPPVLGGCLRASMTRHQREQSWPQKPKEVADNAVCSIAPPRRVGRINPQSRRTQRTYYCIGYGRALCLCLAALCAQALLLFLCLLPSVPLAFPWSFSLSICVPLSHYVCVLHLFCLFRGRLIFYIPTHSLIFFFYFIMCPFPWHFPITPFLSPLTSWSVVVFFFILLLSNPSSSFSHTLLASVPLLYDLWGL